MRRAVILIAVGVSACAPEAVPVIDVPSVTTVPLSAAIPSAGRLGGVAADADGNVYVSNFGASVFRVDPEGGVTEVSNQIRGTSGNAIDRQGRLYQASFLGNTILRFNEQDEMEVFADSGLSGPVGLAVDNDGTVFVCNCNDNSIAAVSTEGEVSTIASGSLFACPNGITLGPDGSAYVVNFGNSHVLRVTREGDVSVLATFPGDGNAHIVHAAGAFFVTRIATNEIVRVELDGSFARWAGTGAVGFDDGPLVTATLARPNGIAVSADGRFLYINNIVGEWRGEEPTSLVLRKLGPVDDEGPDESEPPLSGASLESIEIAVGDFVFDALAAGPADGDLVFLLHGFPQTSFAFRHQLRALAAAGYRAVAPDQRGYSPRARPAGVAPYAIGNLVNDVTGMADALGVDRFHLVGHDWGGAVAWATALRTPGRVRSLTVLSTPHFGALSAAIADPSGDQARRSAYFGTLSQPGAEAALLEDDAAPLRAIWTGLGEEAIDEYLGVLGQPEALRAALAWYAAAFGGTAATTTPTAAPPPPIQVPTLYVWSTEDQYFGREAVLATAQFVGGSYRFVVLEGVNHWVPEHAPGRTAQLLLDHLGRQPS